MLPDFGIQTDPFWKQSNQLIGKVFFMESLEVFHYILDYYTYRVFPCLLLAMKL